MGEWSAPALPAGWTISGQPPFVARHDEVAALESAWADVLAGAGRVVLVSGEPGSGKSRLVAEVCTKLHAAGATVLFGACALEFGAPFEPFVDPLRALVAADRSESDATGRGETDATSRVETDATSRSESFELLDRVLTRSIHDAEARVAGPDRMFDAVLDVLQSATAARPIVLVLDDLHWAGPAAVRLLVRVVVGMQAHRLLLVGTFRNAPPDRSGVLVDAVASLNRLSGVERIELAPFTTEEITEYVMANAGLTPSGARDSAEALSELTGGNAFLLREMWRRVVEAERRDGARIIELPDSVGDLVRSRLATLEPAQRVVLELAAVLGQEVEVNELVALDEASADHTLGAMDAAVRAGLIESPREPGDRYRFPHAIARQAVIDAMSSGDLLRTHAHIAQTLEADFPTTPELIQRLAHHYSAARALGFGDRAITYLIRAAELSEHRYASEDAGRMLQQAAAISSDAGERGELLLRAAADWDLAADTARARLLYEEVAETGDARQRLRAAMGYEDASWRPGLLGHRARDLLSAGLASVPEDPADPLYVEALGSFARATAFTGSVDEAERIGDRAVELARALDHPMTLASVLRSTSTLTLRPRGIAKRQARSRELLELTRSTDNEWMAAATLHIFANSYLLGERADLEASAVALTEMSRKWGGHWNYWVACLRFGRALIAGRLDDAAVAYRQAQRDEIAFRGDATPGANAVQEYMLRRESGRLDPIRRVITGEESPVEHWAPGLLALYTDLGLETPTRRVLDWLLERTESSSADSSVWSARLVFLAEAALLLGDAEVARRVHAWLSEYAGLNLMAGIFLAPFGPADCYLGELESLVGAGDPMPRFESALDLAERTGAPLHVARTLAATAAHLRRVDPRSREATDYAARARAIAAPAGMARVLRSLDSADATAAAAPGGLTSREREVIGLIAEGRSNRDIAARLMISEHTAANHVRSILTKIGAENRTQAAMFARERGLA
ncbi:helix-turn-helix transcriptional regulator [Agromyces luteolus]|uniref:AAA family ATPase n=1 Tax=Agromyces luteolus TaxID=88373 RepID=A0A7C9M071_9MICO|nr:helix-turn-helix transcriptional regulator [Agromyces luteolus]MUN08153.1 AAA family ATPase [Agromyces luteolus]